MNTARVLLGRRRPTDHGAQSNQRRTVSLSLSGLDRIVEGLHILNVVARTQPVDALSVPAVGTVASLNIFGEGNVGVVLNRDLVVVPNDHKLAQLLVAGKRRRLGSHAFLQVAIGSDHVDAVIERRLTRRSVLIEQAAHPALSVSETNS